MLGDALSRWVKPWSARESSGTFSSCVAYMFQDQFCGLCTLFISQMHQTRLRIQKVGADMQSLTNEYALI